VKLNELSTSRTILYLLKKSKCSNTSYKARNLPFLTDGRFDFWTNIWESSAPKLQAHISRAENAEGGWSCGKQSRVEDPVRDGDCGCILVGAAADATTWLTASPAWPENRMNDVAFRTAFQLRNLIPVVTENGFAAGRKWTLYLL
jgi:hypothetical protein